jgi:hypothetical protein
VASLFCPEHNPQQDKKFRALTPQMRDLFGLPARGGANTVPQVMDNFLSQFSVDKRMPQPLIEAIRGPTTGSGKNPEIRLNCGRQILHDWRIELR